MRVVARGSTHGFSLIELVVALAVFAAFAKVLPWFKQDNTVWLALLVPLHLGLAVAMRYARRG